MAGLNEVFWITRVVTLLLVILFSEFVLVIGAIMTDSLRGSYLGITLAVTTSALTLLIVPVMIFLSSNRKGAFLSMIVVELGCLGVLWVLWLTITGMIVSVWVNDCGSHYLSSRECMKIQTMAGFSFLTCLLLLELDIFLFSLVILHSNRGNSAIWTSFVNDVDYSAVPATSKFVETGSSVKLGATPTMPRYPRLEYVPSRDRPRQVVCFWQLQERGSMPNMIPQV